MAFSALLFDFDGLILDTEGPAFESWREVYREYGCELSIERWAEALGGSGGELDHHAYLQEQTGQALDRADIYRRRLERKVALIDGKDALPGVREIIAAAGHQGLRLAVVSSSRRPWVDGYLTKLGLRDAFDVIVCGDEQTPAKPHPDLYLKALDALGVAPEAALAFEDSPNGITAAQRAGIRCVAVPNDVSRRLSVAHADLELRRLNEMRLDDLLTRLAGTATPSN